MTMFPQEPYSQVGGCTHNLTQTTQVQARYPLPVARVRGYYYRTPLPMRCGSLSRILPLRGHLVDTLVSQVIACLRAPTHEAKVLDVARPLSAFVEGAGQRACTVPTSATTLYLYNSTKVGEWLPRRPPREVPTALSSHPVNGDGTSRAGLLRCMRADRPRGALLPVAHVSRRITQLLAQPLLLPQQQWGV